MSTFGLRRSLIAFAAFIGLALAPNSAFAQHGGGGGSHGGGGGGSHAGGGFYGGGGGFHGGGGGSSHAGGGFYGGGDRGYRGGGFGGGARSFGRGSYSHSGGSEAGRNFGSSGNHSSNVRPAINDGQWHSFGNAGGSARSSAGTSVRSSAGSAARSSEGRNSGGLANSSLRARNAGISDGRWHSFGPSSGASQRGSGAPGSVRGPSRAAPGFGRGGDGWRGGWPGYGWGRGRGFGWGWGGWGFGVGWPYWGGYWGPYWALGWNPWWYDPYWYGAWPAYTFYPDYSYDWSDNPPPYRPDSSSDRDSPASYLSPPNSNPSSNHSSNYDDNHFNLNPGSSPGNNGSVQNGQTPPPEAAPNSPAPTA